MVTTWRAEITREMTENADSWDGLECCTMGDLELDQEFENPSGHSTPAFTVWTHERVYFPGTYDGWGWCASVSRYPDHSETKPVGGG